MSILPPTESDPSPLGPEPPEQRHPSLWIAPAALLAGLLGGVFITLFIGILGSTFGSPLGHPTPAVSLAADYFFDFAFVAAALWFAVLQGHMSAADFGYRRIDWRVGARAVAVAGVAYYLVTYVYSSLLSLHGTDKLPNELGVSHSTAAAIAAAFFVCAVAPMAEEFFFRGFLFGVLRQMHIPVAGRELGPWVAAVIVGLLFGLAHTGSAASQYLVPLGFLGFVLCLVRWRTGSLYPCMALHSINNSLALGINQLNWGLGLILLLVVGSLALIGAITLPLSRLSGPRADVGRSG